MSYLLDYSKAIKVVESVKTIPHYDTAKRYVNLFMEKWTNKSFNHISKKNKAFINAPETIAIMYLELNKKLDDKKNAISL